MGTEVNEFSRRASLVARLYWSSVCSANIANFCVLRQVFIFVELGRALFASKHKKSPQCSHSCLSLDFYFHWPFSAKAALDLWWPQTELSETSSLRVRKPKELLLYGHSRIHWCTIFWKPNQTFPSCSRQLVLWVSRTLLRTTALRERFVCCADGKSFARSIRNNSNLCAMVFHFSDTGRFTLKSHMIDSSWPFRPIQNWTQEPQSQCGALEIRGIRQQRFCLVNWTRSVSWQSRLGFDCRNWKFACICGRTRHFPLTTNFHPFRINHIDSSRIVIPSFIQSLQCCKW